MYLQMIAQQQPSKSSSDATFDLRLACTLLLFPFRVFIPAEPRSACSFTIPGCSKLLFSVSRSPESVWLLPALGHVNDAEDEGFCAEHARERFRCFKRSFDRYYSKYHPASCPALLITDCLNTVKNDWLRALVLHLMTQHLLTSYQAI